jgi:hypothetical protein
LSPPHTREVFVGGIFLASSLEHPSSCLKQTYPSAGLHIRYPGQVSFAHAGELGEVSLSVYACAGCTAEYPESERSVRRWKCFADKSGLDYVFAFAVVS